MNVLTALAIPFAGALMYGVPAAPAPVVSSITRGGSAAAAGLQRGDRIVSFNGIENPKWDTIRGDALLSPGQPLPVVVERNGQRVPLTITPVAYVEDGETAGFLDFLPDYGDVPVVVREVEAGTPAAEAGLQPGDRIISISGQPVSSAEQVTQFIRDHKGQPITLTVNRDGRQIDITATPGSCPMVASDSVFDPMKKFRCTQSADHGRPRLRRRHQSANSAIDRKSTGSSLYGTTFGAKHVVRPNRNLQSGRLGSGEIWLGRIFHARSRFLSLNLGIFNLLPIPVLDGGAIFLLLIEGLLATVGLSISMRVRERIQQVGFVMVFC